jgi:hypothetical protein
MARPEVKAKISANSKAAHARPEVKAKISASLKARWARPEVKAKISGDNNVMKRPEVRAKSSKARHGLAQRRKPGREGPCGVYPEDGGAYYVARFDHKYIGRFKTLEEAIAARQQAEFARAAAELTPARQASEQSQRISVE